MHHHLCTKREGRNPWKLDDNISTYTQTELTTHNDDDDDDDAYLLAS